MALVSMRREEREASIEMNLYANFTIQIVNKDKHLPLRYGAFRFHWGASQFYLGCYFFPKKKLEYSRNSRERTYRFSCYLFEIIVFMLPIKKFPCHIKRKHECGRACAISRQTREGKR